MQIIENTKVKEKLYIEKLEDGLTIMVIPKEKIQKKYVIWGIYYGSIDNKFIIPGENEETKIPDGVAHYLEHKLFEQEDGTNSLDTLTTLGANANAYTTNDHTAYLFETTDNFYEALDELANYVQHPYFTDENVEKEKGIIGQEIMMYDDYPEFVVYMNAMQAMYKNIPVRIDIAGTLDSISKIDKEVLYKCYNTFYNPSNMAIVVCGDFEPNEIIKEIKQRLVNIKPQGKIERIYEKEPEEVNEKIIQKQMEVSIPLFVIGFKDKVETNKQELIKKHIAIEIILNLLIGNSSDLYKELYEEGIIFRDLELSYEFTDIYAHAIIGGQATNVERVEKGIKEKIEELIKNGINNENFERIKKSIYGSYIKEYNDISNIAKMFLADYFNGINSFEYIENYELVTKEYAEKVLEEVFKEEKMVTSIINSK